jgi:hypothetical protein
MQAFPCTHYSKFLTSAIGITLSLPWYIVQGRPRDNSVHFLLIVQKLRNLFHYAGSVIYLSLIEMHRRRATSVAQLPSCNTFALL